MSIPGGKVFNQLASLFTASFFTSLAIWTLKAAQGVVAIDFGPTFGVFKANDGFFSEHNHPSIPALLTFLRPVIEANIPVQNLYDIAGITKHARESVASQPSYTIGASENVSQVSFLSLH